MATIAERITRQESFYQKMAAGLAVLILFAFGQFAARGFVDYRQAPLIVHIHGAAMVAWLGLLVVQSTLAQRMDLALHRRLGWFGLALVLAIPPLAIATCVTMLRAHAFPPFFTPSFFLVLVTVESLAFSSLVVSAIAMRRRTDWHRRLMIGATIILLEPAFGRLLPMPLMGLWGEWVAMVLQLVAVGIVARHDLSVRGKIHGATLVAGGMIVFTHVFDTLAAMAPPVVALAGSIYG
jgi:hypothetical protein